MPMYEYKCLECEEVQEAIVSFAVRDEPRECECGGETQRVISRPGLVWAPTAGGMR